ncbi:hypothetical protein AB1Y20_012655 [Prymnesium parvum]|uniref:JmjC domain-containing protein n=1 Tax=Prymnesium parvum TaxID=97485 RepID=A0AB34IM20_PRYPA
MAHWPDLEPAVLPNAVPIDRREKLEPRETMGRYLLARGGEGCPVVVTDAQQGWKARKLWSLDYFKKHFPDEEVIASDRAPLRLEDNPPMKTLRVRMAEYVDYMQQPYHPLSRHERDMPFYGNSWSPFVTHERMRSHISRPYFVPDSIPSDNGSERLDRSFTKIFMGPAGTVTRLHNDTYHTHAWLSQISGTKQFILYPPSQAHLLHCGEGIQGEHGASQTWFDPLALDYQRFPRAREATPFVAVCSAGDTILVPGDWFHHATSLTPSITLMRNFMNDANAERFMKVWMERPANAAAAPRPRPPLAPPQPPPALPPAKRASDLRSPTAAAASASPPPPSDHSPNQATCVATPDPSSSLPGVRSTSTTLPAAREAAHRTQPSPSLGLQCGRVSVAMPGKHGKAREVWHWRQFRRASLC